MDRYSRVLTIANILLSRGDKFSGGYTDLQGNNLEIIRLLLNKTCANIQIIFNSFVKGKFSY